jgi:hypothetical protein
VLEIRNAPNVSFVARHAGRARWRGYLGAPSEQLENTGELGRAYSPWIERPDETPSVRPLGMEDGLLVVRDCIVQVPAGVRAKGRGEMGGREQTRIPFAPGQLEARSPISRVRNGSPRGK